MFNGIEKNNLYLSTSEAARNKTIKKELDKDAFLQLLVTQLKYQDPTSPLDNKELIAQMSQLSTTEQIMNMSKSFQGMVDSQISLQKMQASSLIGKSAVVEANTVQLTQGVSENFTYNLEKDSVISIEIQNADGKTVYSENLGAVKKGVSTYLWNGRDNSGTNMPDGEYEVKLYRYENGKKTEVSGLRGGKVEAVQFIDKEFYVLIDGKRYPVKSIKEISNIA